MTPLSTAVLDIVPGKSAGPFHLGDSLWKTLEYLRTHSAEFPKIQVAWSVEIAPFSAVVIRIVPHIVLTFPSTTPAPSLQLLQHIRIIELPEALRTQRVRVIYRGRELGAGAEDEGSDRPRGMRGGSSHSCRITSKTVEKAFGPTWTPDGREGAGAGSRLKYRGVSFGLKEPAEGTGSAANGTKHNQERTICDIALYNHGTYEHSGGMDLDLDEPLLLVSEPIVSLRDDRTSHSRGSGIAASRAESATRDDFKVTEVMIGTLRSCEVVPGSHVVLNFFSQSARISGGPQTADRSDDAITIALHSSTSQDLLLDLGPPIRKYRKEDNRSNEVWGETSRRDEAVRRRDGRNVNGGTVACLDEEEEQDSAMQRGTWWNYFQLGMDFLVADAGRSAGKIIKVMMHSNIPGTAAFQRHAKCPWIISTPSGSLYTCTSQLEDVITIHGGTKSFDAHSGQPKTMSLDRTIEDGLEGVTGIDPSRLSAIKGLVLEEARGGGIVSVLIN